VANHQRKYYFQLFHRFVESQLHDDNDWHSLPFRSCLLCWGNVRLGWAGLSTMKKPLTSLWHSQRLRWDKRYVDPLQVQPSRLELCHRLNWSGWANSRIKRTTWKYNLFTAEATLVPDDLSLSHCMYLVFQYLRLASPSFAHINYPRCAMLE